MTIVFAGCGVWRSNENTSITLAPPPKSEYPFSVNEPAVFQTDLIIRTGETERRLSIARNGNLRRFDFDVGTDNHRAVLIADKEYLLFFKRKTYEERALSTNTTAIYEPLTAQMLSSRDYSNFDEVSRVGSVLEFRARINESANSEVLILFDEAIGLPVRQEFYSIEGETRKLQYEVELDNFRTDVSPEVFIVPRGFRLERRNK